MTRQLRADDLYAIKTIAAPQLSPDAHRVAYVQTDIIREDYEYQETIWVIPTAGGEARRFTTGPHDTTPRWSPDGKFVAFLRAPERDVKPSTVEERNRGIGKPQIWIMPADGGEALKLTWAPYGVGDFIWAPDGKTLIYAALAGDRDDIEAEDAAVTGRTVPHVRTIDRLWYRYEGIGFTYDQHAHLFRVRADGSGEPQQLTSGDYEHAEPAISPDGTRLAFTSDHSEDRWRWPAPSVWVLDLRSGSLTRVSDESLSTGAPTWSPDGSTIAFLGSPRRHGTGHTDLYVTASDSATKQRLLTQDFTPTASDTTLDDMRTSHGHAHLSWSPDGRDVYFLGAMRGTSHVYAAPVSGELLPRRITDGSCRVFAFALDRAAKTLVTARSTPTIPSDLYVQAVPHGTGAQHASHSPNGHSATAGQHALTVPAARMDNARRLTDVNQAVLGDVELGEPQEYPFRGADGWELQGWVLRPPQVGAGETVDVPAILEVHGGPHAMYGSSFMFEFQLLRSHGYAVVFTNPRGSTGYGRVFSGAVTNDWGGKDFEDVMAGLDAAIALGGIDPNRLGIAGGSYGGFMTNWAVGHSNRFKAAVTMRSVVNMATMFGMSDIGWDLAIDELSATPWQDPERVARFSPVTYAATIHTPLLIIHSENDLRCPIGEAEQLYTILKFLDRTTTFVRFEGQNHELSRGGHPRSRVIRLQKIVEWFERYLPTGITAPQTPEPATATASERG